VEWENHLVISIAETSDGTVWMGTRDAGLFSLHDGQVSVHRSLPDRKINCLLSGTGSGLWAGTDNGLVRRNGNGLTQGGVPPALLHAQVLALARDRDSNLWVGTRGGLMRIDEHGVPSEDQPESHRSVNALFEDREGNLWVGGTDGIERYRDSVFLTYSSSKGHGAEDDGPLYVDAAGRTWFGPAAGGFSWLQGSKRGKVLESGLSEDTIYSIAGGPGELWIGRQRGGLTQLREEGGSFAARTYTNADGLPPGSIYAVYRSRDGTVWAGTLNGGLSRLRNGRFSRYTTANGLVSNTIYAIEEGADGTIWVATSNGLQEFAHDRWRVYTSTDGLPPGRVNCLVGDSSGVLWIGTDAGLAFIRGRRLQLVHEPPEILVGEILGIAEDGYGYLWIATFEHVVRAPRANLLGDLPGQWAVREFGLADGIPATEGVRRNHSVMRDHLGRIWFSLHGGISVVDPARVAAGSVPALVHIQTVIADGQVLSTGVPLRIPTGRQRITFRYIGLSLSVPDRLRFRYRMDGFDRDWSEPNSARETVYTNLGPGSYRFRVVASNSDGVWNSSEATVGMEILPRVWETAWFRFAIVGVFFLGIIAAYRLRLHQLTARLNLRFEERLAERTRIAHELHDTLLQGFISASMQAHVAVDQLPEDAAVKPAFARVLGLMRQVIDEGRNAVRGLRSTQDASLGLEHAFSRIQEEFLLQEQSGEHVDFRVIVEGQQKPLNPALRDEVYRIGREALLNAFRHARAKKIEIELDYSSKGLRMLVRDDGSGIDPAILRSGRDGHWGLSGMRERADRIGARLRVFSRNSAGTEVELSVPGHSAFLRQPKPRLGWFDKYMRRSAEDPQPLDQSGKGN
jgi:signal transduction histidine kinase/ligand-binding sensor domain-containing protein